MPTVHPTAIVEAGAELSEGVVVGAYAYLGPRVRLGPGCEVRHHATVEGNTWLGAGNRVFPYAFLGGPTQDLKYAGGDPALRIGDSNTFREFCTVHTATPADGETRIGSHNLFLAYTHIAHDCRVGDHVIMSNNGTLAGHVMMDDHVVVGGLTAIHQFCRLGAYAMLGGCGKVVQDVPPYMIADGSPAQVRTINKIGLERGGFTPEQIGLVRRLYKAVYREGHNLSQAVAAIQAWPEAADPMVRRFLDFLQGSQRGIC